MKRVVCPPGAGAGSTIGMLMAPARVDRVASFTLPLAGADMKAAEDMFAALEKESLDVLRLTGADIEGRTVKRLADMRYIGQGSEITVTMPSPLTEAGVRAAFEVAYKALFARTPPGAAIQFVAIRLSVTAPMPGTGGKLETAASFFRECREGDAARLLPGREQDGRDQGLGPLRAGARREDRRAGRVRGRRKHLHRRTRRDRASAGRRIHPGGGELMSSLGACHSVASLRSCSTP